MSTTTRPGSRKVSSLWHRRASSENSNIADDLTQVDVFHEKKTNTVQSAITSGQRVSIMSTLRNCFSLFVIMLCRKQRSVYLSWLHLQLLLLANKPGFVLFHSRGIFLYLDHGAWAWCCCTGDWISVFKHCLLSRILFKLLNQINLIVLFDGSCETSGLVYHVAARSPIHRSIPTCLHASSNTASVRQGSKTTDAASSVILRWHRAVSPECKFKQSDGQAPLAVWKRWYFHNAVTAQGCGPSMAPPLPCPKSSLCLLLFPVYRGLTVPVKKINEILYFFPRCTGGSHQISHHLMYILYSCVNAWHICRFPDRLCICGVNPINLFYGGCDCKTPAEVMSNSGVRHLYLALPNYPRSFF